jgi:hypothetical protein
LPEIADELFRIFPLSQEDKDSASANARRVVKYYDERRKRAGKRLGFHTQFQTQLWYVGFCAENAIARILNGQVDEGESYGTEWDVDIPELGHLQIKTTQAYGLNPFPVKEPRNILPDPNGLVWLTYYRESDIQKVTELTWSQVFKFPKEGQFYQVQIPTEFWDRVER